MNLDIYRHLSPRRSRRIAFVEGIKSREDWLKDRKRDIEAAIARYVAAKMDIPYAWYEELKSLS